MNKSDRNAITYISREHSKLIDKSDSYSNNYNNLKFYLDHYIDIDNEKLREIFSYFHESINRLVESHNQSDYEHEEDYRYSITQIDNIFSKIKTFQYNLKDTKYAFKIQESYDKYIIKSSNQSYTDLELMGINPIFELVNNKGLELFQELIEKLVKKDRELGLAFQLNVEFQSYENNILTWVSNAKGEDKEILKDNFSLIKSFTQDIFGFETKIKKIEADSLNSKKEREKMIPVKSDTPKKFSNDKIGNLDFSYKNILFKGVPGTGKSRTLENIINNHLNLEEHYDTNVLRINIHSASSNADLMQGIAINSNSDGSIEYKEKQGLVLELIERATFNPNQPFVLVLEEIQENSLNELIGDLIYLVEDSKRADKYVADNKEYAYSELVTEIMKQNSKIDSVELPSLISKQEKIKRMVIPHNLFIFCTSNYRDDRKVIEDNLLRRFDVIEIYPKSREEIGKDEDGDFIFRNEDTSDFLEELNKSIVSKCKDNGEIHPDRFMIGHSIWLKVEDKKAFSRAFLKVITEFKDVKDMHFDDFKKITDKLDFPFELEKEYESYEEWIKVLQKECYTFLSDN